MKGNINILHIMDSLGFGGAETWMLNCLKYIKENKIDCKFTFLLTGGERSELDEFFERNGAELIYIKFSRKNLIEFIVKYRNILRANNFTAIYNHGDFVSGWHYLFGVFLLPKNRISHLHNPLNFVNNYISSTSRFFSYTFGVFLMSIFSTIITGTSNEVMDNYGYNNWPFKRKRRDPIYCGFKISDFIFQEDKRLEYRTKYGISQECKVILFVGRISLNKTDKAKNQKNPEFAFEIAKYAISKSPKLKFVFVGNVDPEIKNRKDLQPLINSNSLIFTGLRNDVHAFYSMSDVLIFPSLWEGLGMVSVEAQVSGLKIVCSENIPKEADIILENITRLSLNEPFDNWYRSIIKDDQEIKRKSCADACVDSQFDIKNSVNSILKYSSYV